MRKSKVTKIISSIALSLMLGVSLFAGCNLVTRDMARYYNTVVASFTYDSGEKVNVTKRELITSYNSFGYQYTQYGLSTKDAYKQTIDRIIEKKLTIREAENDAKKANGGEILTTKEKTYLWEETFNAIKSNILSYYNDLNHITDDEDSDAEEGVVTQNAYTPLARLVPHTAEANGKVYTSYTIEIEQTVEDDVNSHVYWSTVDRDVTKQSDKEALFNEIVAYVDENPDYTRAFNKYFADAKNSEEGQHLSTDRQGVFEREIDRVYTALYESMMVNKYSQKNQTTNSTVTLSNLAELYEQKVLSDYTKYEVEKAKTYDDDVLSKVSSINYFKPDSRGTQYFYVSHLLAKFSDEEQAKYDECMDVINGESKKYTIGQAQDIIEQLYNNLAFPVRTPTKQQDGSIQWKDSGQQKPVLSVMQELVSTFETLGSSEEKATAFTNEFIYKYNEDEGVFNSDRHYVIGIDYNTRDEEKGTSYTIHSNMVEPFTNAAIALYKGGAAQVGDIYVGEGGLASGLIRTEYGIHIMIYEGRVENLFSGIDSSFSVPDSALGALNTPLKAGEEKTVFDSLYEEMNSSSTAVFENMNLQVLKSKIKIVYNMSEFKDLYED